MFFFEFYDAYRQGRDAHKRTTNATFNLEELLLAHQDEDGENGGGGGIQIDLSEFLNGDGDFANNDENNNNNEEMIDLTALLNDDDEDNQQQQQGEEELDITEFLVDDDENNNDNNNIHDPGYELDEGDTTNANNNNDYLLDGEDQTDIQYDDDGRAIGVAARANAAQHAELSRMLSTSRTF